MTRDAFFQQLLAGLRLTGDPEIRATIRQWHQAIHAALQAHAWAGRIADALGYEFDPLYGISRWTGQATAMATRALWLECPREATLRLRLDETDAEAQFPSVEARELFLSLARSVHEALQPPSKE